MARTNTPLKKVLTGFSVASLAALTLAACGSTTAGSGDAGDPLAPLKQRGCARVGLAQAPPYVSVTKDGTAGGYLPDVTQRALNALGVPKLCTEVATYDAMIPALQAGQYDLLPGGLNITAERCNAILFSEPLTAQHEAIAVPKGNPKNLSSFADVGKDRSVKLAVFSGSSQEAFALKNGVDRSQLVTVPDSQTGVEAVKTGRADAFGASQFTLELNFAKKGEPIDVMVDKSSALSMIGIGFRQDAKALRDKFDEELAKIKSSGELAKLYTQHGFPNPDDLAGVSRGDVSPSCK